MYVSVLLLLELLVCTDARTAKSAFHNLCECELFVCCADNLASHLILYLVKQFLCYERFVHALVPKSAFAWILKCPVIEVENALKDNTDIEVRSPWGDYDVLYEGKKIEVKCCSYIQDWDQNQFSRIAWSGLKATELYYSDAVKKLSELNKTPEYKSDIYVLALFKHQDHATLDILNMDQWCFYVLTRERLREISKNRSSVSLSLLNKNQITPISFVKLRQLIESVNLH